MLHPFRRAALALILVPMGAVLLIARAPHRHVTVIPASLQRAGRSMHHLVAGHRPAALGSAPHPPYGVGPTTITTTAAAHQQAGPQGGTQPMTPAATIALPGSSLVIPVPHGSGADRMAVGGFAGHDGITFRGAGFYVSGPAPGTVVGKVQVSVASGPHLPHEIHAVARWVDGRHPAQVVRIGSADVAAWPSSEHVDGRPIGQGVRNVAVYALPAPDGRIAEVIFDGIDPTYASRYMAQIVAAWY